VAEVSIAPLAGRQERATRHMLARAFDDDAWFRWLLPDAPRRYAVLRRFFGAGVTDSRLHGRVDVAVEDNLIAAAACWLPPGAYPPSVGRQLRQGLAVAAAVPSFPKRVGIAVRVLNELQRVHPKDEHWYLAILGTDPSRWRRGLGSRLLEPVLAGADEEGIPCYLETQAERNLAFYGRHGFSVVQEVRVAGCPLPLWTMRRPVKAPA
jgi:GNAT superfamily N-acetyltransferase